MISRSFLRLFTATKIHAHTHPTSTATTHTHTHTHIPQVAAQCGHAVLGCYRAAKTCQPALVKRWLEWGQAKVALKVDNEADLEKIMLAAKENGLTAVPIRDAGRTQVQAGTRTVLGIGPAPKPVIDMFTGHLKLL
jgi:PTH2 family peptidyl-tRNA hydrolase